VIWWRSFTAFRMTVRKFRMTVRKFRMTAKTFRMAVRKFRRQSIDYNKTLTAPW